MTRAVHVTTVLSPVFTPSAVRGTVRQTAHKFFEGQRSECPTQAAAIAEHINRF